MGMFTKISSTAFEELQFDAGMVLNAFDPENPKAPTDAEIVTATTGGINVDVKPSYVDLGEDVDNCPNNMMELKRHDGWDVKMSFTALNITPEAIRFALGAADVDEGKVTPRATLALTDFKDIWWVGDRTDGGFAAVKIMNALSESGLSIKTTKKGKGQLDVELIGHVSIEAQDVVPAEFYVVEG